MMVAAAPLVYAMTLNWNRRDDTLACLASLSALDYTHKRLLLVDNGSSDDTVAEVSAQFPDVEIIAVEENQGFAGGANVGLRHALEQGADYVFLINNDATTDPRTLDHLLEVASGNVGIVAPKIYYTDAPDIIWTIGGSAHPLTLEKRGDVRGQADRGQWNHVVERDYFAGCALLLSRPLLEEIGLFDERFFMYYEDSDLSRRARAAGYRLLLNPRAHVWHRVARSSGGSDSPNERYWMARSSVLFFHKHVRGLRWLIVVPYRAGSAVKTVLRLLSRRRPAAAAAYLRGLRDGFQSVRDQG